MKKRKTGKWILIVIILLLAAAAAYYFLVMKKSDDGKSTSQANAMMQARTSLAAVTKGTIEITTQGNGTIEAEDKTTMTADYALRVESVKAENGDDIKAGDVIAVIDRDSIDAQISALSEQLANVNQMIGGASRNGSESLTSPITGRVKQIFAKEGDLLSDVQTRFGGIAVISADGNLKIEFTSPANVRVGDKVKVTFLNYEEEGYISKAEDGCYTAVIDDNANYQVGQSAQVQDENRNDLGSGELAVNYPYLIEGSYGIVDDLKVDVNDWVEAGNTILTRTHTARNASYLELVKSRNDLMEDLRTLRKLREEPEIKAGKEGILTNLMLSEGMMMQPDGAMYTIISTEKFNLKAEIDELDIAGVEVGQNAKVVFDAFEDADYQGTVTKVSRLGNNKGGVTTFTVTVEVPGSEELKTNMSATVTIVTDRAEDALLVPVDAIQTENERKYVTVIIGEESQEREVTLGLVNSTTAQILDGVSEGESVVVIGTSEMEDLMNMMRAGRRSNSSRSSGGEQ